MSEKLKLSSGAKWESIVGYSRAIRIGNVIEVSGTCAVDENGDPYAAGDAFAQANKILEIILGSIEKLGGKAEDVVRTRIFVTNIDDWKEVGRAHGDFFQSIRPVTTMIEISRLISPEYVVEIEASAVIND